MNDDLYIVIPNWERFQHYKDRSPNWIKVYAELHHDDDFLALTFHQRGVLLGLWLEYAASHRQLVGSTATITRRLGHRVSTATLEALNHAGFIHFSASKPLALARSRREEKEVRKSKDFRTPYDGSALSRARTVEDDATGENLHATEEP